MIKVNSIGLIMICKNGVFGIKEFTKGCIRFDECSAKNITEGEDWFLSQGWTASEGGKHLCPSCSKNENSKDGVK